MTTPARLPSAVLQHLGSLHAYETVLVLVIAFGPFLVVWALVLRERRRSGEGSGRSSGAHGAHPQDRRDEPRS